MKKSHNIPLRLILYLQFIIVFPYKIQLFLVISVGGSLANDPPAWRIVLKVFTNYIGTQYFLSKYLKEYYVIFLEKVCFRYNIHLRQ